MQDIEINIWYLFYFVIIDEKIIIGSHGKKTQRIFALGFFVPGFNLYSKN
jgi:hypothetical protein